MHIFNTPEQAVAEPIRGISDHVILSHSAKNHGWQIHLTPLFPFLWRITQFYNPQHQVQSLLPPRNFPVSFPILLDKNTDLWQLFRYSPKTSLALCLIRIASPIMTYSLVRLGKSTIIHHIFTKVFHVTDPPSIPNFVH